MASDYKVCVVEWGYRLIAKVDVKTGKALVYDFCG
jgi:hypothetical protein